MTIVLQSWAREMLAIYFVLLNRTFHVPSFVKVRNFGRRVGGDLSLYIVNGGKGQLKAADLNYLQKYLYNMYFRASFYTLRESFNLH